MKKILSLLIMAVFLISLVPATFAAQGSGKATATPTQYQTGGERDEFISKAEQLRTELQEKRGEAIATRTRQAINVAEKRQEQLRKFQENKQELKEVIQKAVQRRQQAIDKYREAKSNLEKAKEKIQKCKGKSDATCTEERRNARKHAQQFMLNAADRMLGLLEKTKERIQASDLSEEEKAEVIADLEDRMEDIASARETIDETTEAATTDEIKESAKMIRDSWRKANKEIKQKASRAAVGKIGGTLVKIEKLEIKLERTVAKLKEKGYDTTPIEVMMQQFEAKIQEAKDEHALAMEKFQAGNANEATVNVRAAHAKIKEAHKLLKDVVRKIRKATQGESIQEEGLEPETQAEEQAAEAAEEEAEQAAEAEEQAAETEDTSVDLDSGLEEDVSEEETEDADETAETEEESPEETQTEETTEEETAEETEEQETAE